jgi:ubiquinone/menaquinone biosynthesis C-methylase UbiE
MNTDKRGRSKCSDPKTPQPATPDYALGYTETESQRLIRQSEFYAEFTEDVLRRAGLDQGMRVLDIGCGPGDVSLLAARLVGPTGAVVAADRSGKSLAQATERARRENIRNILLVQGELTDLEFTEPFDALIGRFVLMFLPDPAAVLRRLTQFLNPGGIVAFQEMIISHSRTEPQDLPLWIQCGTWITKGFIQSGVDIDMGAKLYSTYRKAGLPGPAMNLHARISGGHDSPHAAYLADIISSMLPVLEHYGIAKSDEVGIETLAARLQKELEDHDAVSILPSLVGAWTRKQIV